MELSNYTKDQLISLQVAIECTLSDCRSLKGVECLATDLTYWKGEVIMALSDKEIEENRLPFPA